MNVTKDEMLSTAKALFDDLLSNASSKALMSNFSTTQPVSLHHYAVEDLEAPHAPVPNPPIQRMSAPSSPRPLAAATATGIATAEALGYPHTYTRPVKTRSPCASTYLLSGHTAVRSYFDTICTHWTRTSVVVHHSAYTLPCPGKDGQPDQRGKVTADFSIEWRWNRTGNCWTEDATMELDFDEAGKIINLVAQTTSGRETCVMHATMN